MNEVILNTLKEKPLIIPKILFRNYKKMNITEEELIIIICLINLGDKIPYNPNLISMEIGMDKYNVMQILNNLSEKNIINIKVENEKKNKFIYLDFLYLKLFNILMNDNTIEEEKKEENNDIFSLFEQELGRPISPMEVEIIKEWLHDGFSEDIIKEALKEAIYNDVRNLKYIDRILFNWKGKGYKNPKDIIKDKKNYKKKETKQTEIVFDYNWLEDEQE